MKWRPFATDSNGVQIEANGRMNRLQDALQTMLYRRCFTEDALQTILH